MNKEARGGLLRAIHHAKAGGMAYKPTGKPVRSKLAAPVVERIVVRWPEVVLDTKSV